MNLGVETFLNEKSLLKVICRTKPNTSQALSQEFDRSHCSQLFFFEWLGVSLVPFIAPMSWSCWGIKDLLEEIYSCLRGSANGFLTWPFFCVSNHLWIRFCWRKVVAKGKLSTRKCSIVKNHYIWGPLFGSRKRVIYPFHWMAIRCINWCCRQPTGQYKVPVRQGWWVRSSMTLEGGKSHRKRCSKDFWPSVGLGLSWADEQALPIAFWQSWQLGACSFGTLLRWSAVDGWVVFRTCRGDWRFEVKLKGKDSRSSKSVGLHREKV